MCASLLGEQTLLAHPVLYLLRLIVSLGQYSLFRWK